MEKKNPDGPSPHPQTHLCISHDHSSRAKTLWLHETTPKNFPSIPLRARTYSSTSSHPPSLFSSTSAQSGRRTDTDSAPLRIVKQGGLFPESLSTSSAFQHGTAPASTVLKYAHHCVCTHKSVAHPQQKPPPSKKMTTP